MAALHNDHEQLREGALLAAERRAHEAPSMNVKQLAHIHDLKQNFRRLIDPGIMRPNNKETALLALKVIQNDCQLSILVLSGGLTGK